VYYIKHNNYPVSNTFFLSRKKAVAKFVEMANLKGPVENWIEMFKENGNFLFIKNEYGRLSITTEIIQG
jgi:hypothetical protein